MGESPCRVAYVGVRAMAYRSPIRIHVRTKEKVWKPEGTIRERNRWVLNQPHGLMRGEIVDENRASRWRK